MLEPVVYRVVQETVNVVKLLLPEQYAVVDRLVVYRKGYLGVMRVARFTFLAVNLLPKAL